MRKTWILLNAKNYSEGLCQDKTLKKLDTGSIKSIFYSQQGSRMASLCFYYLNS